MALYYLNLNFSTNIVIIIRANYIGNSCSCGAGRSKLGRSGTSLVQCFSESAGDLLPWRRGIFQRRKSLTVLKERGQNEREKINMNKESEIIDLYKVEYMKCTFSHLANSRHTHRFKITGELF